MLLLYNSASCVRLKYKNGCLNLLFGVLMSCLMVFTSYEVCEFFWRPILPLSILPYYGLYKGHVVDHLCVDCVIFCWGLCPLVFCGLLKEK